MPEVMSAGGTIRDATRDDLDWMLPLNNAAAPAVNTLNLAELDQLLAWAAHCLVAEHEGAPAGFVLALPGPGLTYGSDNYRRFSVDFDRFLYVDRVVVNAESRSAGIGGDLYRALAVHAKGVWPRICAEVNLRPPNPRSITFHERHGFQRVGEQDTAGGTKSVALMEKPL